MTLPEKTNDLNTLIRATRGHVTTEAEIEEQRQSFAYGNTNIENPRITRETVARESKSLKAKQNGSGPA